MTSTKTVRAVWLGIRALLLAFRVRSVSEIGGDLDAALIPAVALNLIYPPSAVVAYFGAVTGPGAHGNRLPGDLPVGEYDVFIGLYDAVSGERLPLIDGGDAALLMELRLGDG